MNLDLQELSADWRTKAACLGLDDLFIFEGHNDTKRKKAQQICRSCPVLTECSEWVESQQLSSLEYGVWAGHTVGQRRRIKYGTVREPVPSKRCDRCLQVKDRAYFARHNTSFDGLRATCRPCSVVGRVKVTRVCLDCSAEFSLFLPSRSRRCLTCRRTRSLERMKEWRAAS